jgi:transcriptional regulator with XRE-family HTH domain
MRPHRLKTFLKRQKIKQTKFADSLGISTAHLSMILGGHRRPSPELARRISRETGIPLESLLFPPKRKDAAA